MLPDSTERACPREQRSCFVLSRNVQVYLSATAGAVLQTLHAYNGICLPCLNNSQAAVLMQGPCSVENVGSA